MQLQIPRYYQKRTIHNHKVNQPINILFRLFFGDLR